jgi:hypothetical protein
VAAEQSVDDDVPAMWMSEFIEEDGGAVWDDDSVDGDINVNGAACSSSSAHFFEFFMSVVTASIFLFLRFVSVSVNKEWIDVKQEELRMNVPFVTLRFLTCFHSLMWIILF